MQWSTQVGNFTTTDKVKVYLCWLELISTKITTWKCQVKTLPKAGAILLLVDTYLHL